MTNPTWSGNRKELLSVVETTGFVTDTKTTNTILSNLLLHTEGPHLSIKATDFETSIVSTVPGTTTGNFDCVVNGKALKIALDGECKEVKLVLHEDRLHVEMPDGTVTLNWFPAEDFPVISMPGGIETVSLPADKLLDALKHTETAADYSYEHPGLVGVHLEDFEGSLVVTGSDGHRLHQYNLPLQATMDSVLFGDPEKSAIKVPVIVSMKGVSLLKHLCKQKSIELGTWYSEVDDKGSPIAPRILVKSGNTVALLRPIGEAYPNFRERLQKDWTFTVKLSRKSFDSALNKVKKLCSPTGTKALVLELTEGNLKLSVVNPDIGESFVNIPVEYRRENFATCLNCYFVLDLCKTLDGDVSFSGGSGGALSGIKFENGGPKWAMLMPMKM